MRGYILAIMLFLVFPIFAQQNEKWDNSLDTARDATYLTPMERAVILELNKARSNPKRYALQVVALMKKRYAGSGNLLVYLSLDSVWVQSYEGVANIDACIREMCQTKPVGILSPSRGLSLAALDHTRDQCRTGDIGHIGIDQSTPLKRILRYEGLTDYSGECIDYGDSDAQAIVVNLLIDDGVPDRGHRKSILNGKYAIVGVSIGKHPKYGVVATIDFAGEYVNSSVVKMNDY